MGACAASCKTAKATPPVPAKDVVKKPQASRSQGSRLPTLDTDKPPIPVSASQPLAREHDSGQGSQSFPKPWKKKSQGDDGGDVNRQRSSPGFSGRGPVSASEIQQRQLGCCFRGVRFVADFVADRLGLSMEAEDSIANRPSTRREDRPFLDQVASFTRQLSLGSRGKAGGRNPNKVSHFSWVLPLLQKITDGKAKGMARRDESTYLTPLFVVAGGCPNKLAPMQAMMYCATDKGSVEFWWLKPKRIDKDQLELNTLTLNAKGQYKNAPQASKSVYSPLAAQFNASFDGRGLHFFIENGRAIIEEQGADGTMRMLVYFIWQEEWSSLLSLGKKYMRGKMCYQRGSKYFARQYRIEGSELILAPEDMEEELSSVLPPDSFQELQPENTWMHLNQPQSRRNLAAR